MSSAIVATITKGNSLGRPLAEAVNYLVESGQDASWLARTTDERGGADL